MWKIYSKDYLKQNPSSCASVMAAAFTAAMFLSLLGCIGYNLWNYEIERILLEGENLSGTVSAAMTPLVGLFAVILGIVCISLILIIRNSFELTMNARVHQFGILSSVGATPKQIRTSILQEAIVLGILPILAGSLLGIVPGAVVVKASNLFAAGAAGRHEAVFAYRVDIFLFTILVSVLTVFFSAWLPARKLSRMTPLEAIREQESFYLKKRKHSPVLSLLFQAEGELAGNALRARKKVMRISTISLLLSFLGFSMMLVLTTLSTISTRHTYFERYQDAWDVMLTVKNSRITEFNLTEELQKLSDVKSVTVYQKAEGRTVLAEADQSEELLALGGFQAVAGENAGAGQSEPEEQEKAETQAVNEEQLWITASIIVLDDNSFLDFCTQHGITPDLNGAIILNRIWDSVNSNFRYKEYIPFVKENSKMTVLQGSSTADVLKENGTAIPRQDWAAGQPIEIPILGYTQEAPVLREEYDNYALVHFIPVSLWKEIEDRFTDIETDSYIRILTKGEASLSDLKEIEQKTVQIVSQRYPTESENRIQEKQSNDRMIQGMQVIFGGFCVLLGAIGIANVFFNTLGFLHQRKREFARYLSIGLTPAGMTKMFIAEALVIALRPLLITLPLTFVFVQLTVTASYLDPAEFWAEAPALPILLFAASIVGFVGLAYYLGGQRLLKCDLNEALRNDTML